MQVLEGRVAVVTGAGRGIGRALAERFLVEGAAVVISARTPTEITRIADTAGGPNGSRAIAVVADATRSEEAHRPVVTAREQFGRVDILVNNAGGLVQHDFDPYECDPGAFEELVCFNLTSAWWATRAALPSMREQGFGRVINIGSGAATHAGASFGYTAAKHGLVGLTKALAARTGGDGITVNCLCPGWTNTPAIDWSRMGRDAEASRSAARAESAQRRILEPGELGAMAVLLASEAGGAITGQTISVDGGYKL